MTPVTFQIALRRFAKNPCYNWRMKTIVEKAPRCSACFPTCCIAGFQSAASKTSNMASPYQLEKTGILPNFDFVFGLATPIQNATFRDWDWDSRSHFPQKRASFFGTSPILSSPTPQFQRSIFHFRFPPKPVAYSVLCQTSPFSTSRTCGTTPKQRSSIPSPALSTAPISLAPTSASPTQAAATLPPNLLKPIRSPARKPKCFGSRAPAATSALLRKRTFHPFTRTG